MRCRTFCAHDNEVAAALGAGRAEAVRHGVAPAAAYETIERHPTREARAVRAAEQVFGDRMKAPPTEQRRTTWVPGCSAAVVAPEDARATLAAVDALAPPGGVRVEASRCCGLPLLEAGDREGFLTAARRMIEALGEGTEAVFGDPGCLHALAVIAPSLGMRTGRRLRHLSELAEASLAKLGRVAIEGDVRWHDPCRLGRGLGLYDPPRAVLARILGRPPDEMDQRRERAECSGAGGQLPRTDRPTAEGIARERAGEHQNAGGGTLVTACPSSARAFRKQMPPEQVIDLGALIARSLSG
jgi:Fe-S oxidoreductase